MGSSELSMAFLASEYRVWQDVYHVRWSEHVPYVKIPESVE